MNELQRQAYLEAMGVEHYFPRFQLPGALPSARCELPVAAPVAPAVEAVVEAMVPPVEQSVPAVTPAAGGGAQAAQALLGAAVTALEPARPSAPAASAAKPARARPVESASAAEIPRFALTVARSQCGILIVDDGLTPEQDYAEYLRLLQNILIAVGAGPQALQLDPFVWPMMKSARVDQSAMAAQQTLAAYIDKQVQALSVRYLLVMGETPRRYLPASEPSGPLRLETPGAGRLLTEPGLKRQLWQELLPLRQALQAPS